MRESGESGQPAGIDGDAGAGRSASRRSRASGADAEAGASAAVGPAVGAAVGGTDSGGQRLRTPDDLRTPDAAPIEDEVRLRAYELYQARGGAAGGELDDWVRAEGEVRRRHSGGSDRRPDEGLDDAAV